MAPEISPAPASGFRNLSGPSFLVAIRSLGFSAITFCSLSRSQAVNAQIRHDSPTPRRMQAYYPNAPATLDVDCLGFLCLEYVIWESSQVTFTPTVYILLGMTKQTESLPEVVASENKSRGVYMAYAPAVRYTCQSSSRLWQPPCPKHAALHKGVCTSVSSALIGDALDMGYIPRIPSVRFRPGFSKADEDTSIPRLTTGYLKA
ncbi:hypothetical protein P175DRAFT_0528093 [Aspergillus ochraceoroseus IBT 24754]|uniref:Uncharacterized protein n=1 Tax=Aspergillus ochraceoroseus IBT 24754 TaxID=1392256 RepID=A0A2T5M7T4_9EURO|nr:uncharacterized protein P175DRAFT_0528093 [Aspergillus ochraceoroseus IBT 24754]PTU24599.1 hypothetical protein P175DRAFT_0528093 [Aspergillus ochraceoroseus IBT 24754]